MYDKDKDGSITIRELGNALRSTGVYDDSQLETMFGEADQDQSRALSFEEFAEHFKDLVGDANDGSVEPMGFSELMSQGQKQEQELQRLLDDHHHAAAAYDSR